MWLYGLYLPLFTTLLGAAKCLDAEISMEAAFQGRCGRGSPCMQLCYELHDGMYECDCTEGYELDKNGYSCQVINSTFQPSVNDLNSRTEEDVLYQRGASFSAKLDNSHHLNNNNLDGGSDTSDSDDGDSGESSINNSAAEDNGDDDDDDDDIRLISDKLRITSKSKTINNSGAVKINAMTTSSLAHNITNASNADTAASIAATMSTLISPVQFNNGNSYYSSKEDMSVYDDVNNNRLNMRNTNRIYQETSSNFKGPSSIAAMTTTLESITTRETTLPQTDSSRSYIHINLYDRIDEPLVAGESGTTDQPISISRRKDSALLTEVQQNFTKEPCQLDCGPEGLCDNTSGILRCLCPFGRAGTKCEDVNKVVIPRFSRKSWMAFPALRGAYKHVQLHIEFRPESFDGIILLTGERDDLTGDFMAVLVHQGFIEFWFDCGSGTGKVRSDETVQLNQWNSITVYRHRWDAWILLNDGSRVQGRSKGLFSRITFREPVFLGGTGNITGLARKLPVFDGMVGCIRKFIANEHEYEFSALPHGDITQGFDVQECTTDRCGRYPCRHGGKCLPSDQGAICLCPLGFGGDLCEMRLDLQVPSFNGSSYLRFAPLGDSSLIWFELKMILKPQQEDGLLLYSGHHEYGDYISLCLNAGYVEFSFDLGSGPAVVRSEFPLSLGRWHTIKVSRTARLAVLKVDQLPEVMTISPNGFWHLSLPHSLFLGGIQNIQNLPLNIRERGSFVGCIQKIEINGRTISVISDALGGTNVDNCPHACVARPCGPLATCIPNMETYECHCNPSNAQCNKAEELPALQNPPNKSNNVSAFNTTSSTPLDELKSDGNNIMQTTQSSTIGSFPQLNRDGTTIEQDILNNNNDHNDNGDKHHQENVAGGDNVVNTNYQNDDDGRWDDNGDDDYDDYYYEFDESGVDIKRNNDRDTSKNANDDSHSNTPNENQPNEEINQKDLMTSTVKATATTTTATTAEEAIATTTTPTETPSSYAISNDESFNDNGDNQMMVPSENNDFSVTRVYGRYMSVDNDRLLQIDKQQLKQTKTNYQKSKARKNRKLIKNPISMSLPSTDPVLNIPQNEFIVDNTEISDTSSSSSSSSSSSRHNGYHRPMMEHGLGGLVRNSGMMMSDDDVLAAESINLYSGEDMLTTKELIDDMERIMKNGNDIRSRASKHKTKNFKKGHGACFTGADSYFHYNDAETMRQVISYKIDLNLRFKTHSINGLILWTGRHSALEEDDFLSLGIENGYLHLRYNLGSGEVNIQYNSTKVSDGLWHRIRAFRNLQEGSLEVDGGKAIIERSPGKLRQLNTDTGLYVGGMPDVLYYTRRRYISGIIGCISEIVLAGELRLSLDPETLGTAHNVEPGIF